MSRPRTMAAWDRRPERSAEQTSGPFLRLAVMGVSTGPGRRSVTEMPRGYSRARRPWRVAMTAALAAP